MGKGWEVCIGSKEGVAAGRQGCKERWPACVCACALRGRPCSTQCARHGTRLPPHSCQQPCRPARLTFHALGAPAGIGAAVGAFGIEAEAVLVSAAVACQRAGRRRGSAGCSGGGVEAGRHTCKAGQPRILAAAALARAGPWLAPLPLAAGSAAHPRSPGGRWGCPRRVEACRCLSAGARCLGASGGWTLG